MTGQPNPLVAQPQDTTTAYAGIGIAESIADLSSGIESGNWVDISIGGLGTSMEALGLITDPVATLLSYGISWLIEHVKPLSDALDWLAGDPDQITAYARTWFNVAGAVHTLTGDLHRAANADIAGWTGTAATAYRGQVGQAHAALAGIAQAAKTISAVVKGAGLVVALVRELVRDLVADCVATLIVRVPQWLAEEGVTFGAATPLVVSQVTSLVGRWVAKIGKLLTALVVSLRKLGPILRSLDGLVGQLSETLRRLRTAGPGASGTPPPGPPRSGSPAGAPGPGRWDPASGDPVPPPVTEGPTMPGREIRPGWPERDAERGVTYLDAAGREQHRVVVGTDGLLYGVDGRPLDTTGGGSVWSRDGNRAIFVMDPHGNLYASNEHLPGRFHHSSFLSGGDVAGAGEIEVRDGRLVALSDRSGHYLPEQRYSEQVVALLRARGIRIDEDQIDLQAPE